jgi:hypothetical protein
MPIPLPLLLEDNQQLLSHDQWECSYCESFNKNTVTHCVACGGSKRDAMQNKPNAQYNGK